MYQYVKQLSASCCICGGGPAGMMLGFLLARAGVDVVVLEKHKDFFRDFRGDTIHPSTFQIIHELGLLDDFLKLPHQEIQNISLIYNGTELPLADFTHLPVAKPAAGLMPQWDFLNFIKSKAEAYSRFKLVMEADVTKLLYDGNRVVGVETNTPGGAMQVHAGLVAGTDGRSSTVRQLAGLEVAVTGAPIDVLWFRISRTDNDPGQAFGRFEHGKIMVLFQRGSYWQCAYVIAKGDFENIQAAGLEAFRKELVEASPFLAERVNEIKQWDDIKLLSVAIDHLKKWYTDGLLCIGDAAHAMSPVGGVGINLAIQDAVAAANILYKPLLKKKPIEASVLQKIQKRRMFPARVTQQLQVVIQKGIISRRSNAVNHQKIPFIFRLAKRIPWLRRLPARIIGMGIRPEHVCINKTVG